MSELALIGLSHHATPLEVRERISFSEEEARQFLKQLQSDALVDEALLISTCNRTELYVSLDSSETLARLKRALQDSKKVGELTWYEKEGVDAIRHLFRVTASLDAMVVGETQIGGQVKAAYARSREMGFLQHVLHRVCQRAFSVAKQVRTETDIGRLPVSVSAVAAELASQIFGDLSDCRVLLLGTGEMSAVTAEYMKSAGVGRLTVVSAAGDHAQEFARRFQAELKGYDQLDDALANADIVIAAARTETPILNRARLEARLQALLCVDIAVPRNIAADVSDMEGVYLYNIDDLKEISEKNISARESERRKAETLVEEAIQKFIQELSTLQVVPAIASLHRKCEEIRSAEVAAVLAQIPDPKLRASVDACTHAIVSKILHQPVMVLKADHGSSRPALDFFRRLFGLEV